MKHPDFYFLPNYSLSEDVRGFMLAQSDTKFVHEMIDAGYRVNVFALRSVGASDYPANPLDVSAELTIGGARYEKSNTRNLIGKGLLYFRAIRMLRAFILDARGLIYIYYPGTICLFGAVFAMLAKKPFALYVRGDWNYRLDFRSLSGFLFRRSEFLIVTGPGFVQKISPYNPNVQPVVPMISLSDSTFRERDYSLGDPITLMYVGRLVKEKGVPELLEAISTLKRYHRNVRLVLLGGGSESEMAGVRKSLDDLSISNDVIVKGYVSDQTEISRLYEDCDVFVFPSYYVEGFPRVVYEAMLKQLPIICTILPGMTGFMIDRRNCIEVPERDSKALTTAIDQLLSDVALRSDLGRRARDDAVSYLKGFVAKSHSDQVIANLEKRASRF